MSQDQQVSTNDELTTVCRQCRQLKEDLHGDICSDCIEGILLNHLPLLKRTLEARYGSMLDQWLNNGRFLQARWSAELDLLVCQERLSGFIRKLVRDAVTQGEAGIVLPIYDEFWKPIQINELLDFIDEQCQEEFRHFIESLSQAINNAPTKEAERELVEMVSGKKRVRKRSVRDEAISVVMITEGTPLPLPAKALIEMRYREDGGRDWYPNVEDGKINSVWKEIEEALPEEVVRLICEDNSF
jgi:hypothetical protein